MSKKNCPKPDNRKKTETVKPHIREGQIIDGYKRRPPCKKK